MGEIVNLKAQASYLKDEIDTLKNNVYVFYNMSKRTTNEEVQAVFNFSQISLNNMITRHNKLLFKISELERGVL